MKEKERQIWRKIRL